MYKIVVCGVGSARFEVNWESVNVRYNPKNNTQIIEFTNNIPLKDTTEAYDVISKQPLTKHIVDGTMTRYRSFQIKFDYMVDLSDMKIFQKSYNMLLTVDGERKCLVWGG